MSQKFYKVPSQYLWSKNNYKKAHMEHKKTKRIIQTIWCELSWLIDPFFQIYISTFENIWILDHLTHRNCYAQRIVWENWDKFDQSKGKKKWGKQVVLPDKTRNVQLLVVSQM